jgi:hypothetical protein
MINAYKLLVGKWEGKRQFGKSRHRCKNNIKMDLKVIVWSEFFNSE